MSKITICLLVCLCFSIPSFSTTYYTTSSGVWGPGGTPNLFSTSIGGPGTIGGNVNTASHTIVILANHTVTLSGSVACRALTVYNNGTLLGGTPSSGEWNAITIDNPSSMNTSTITVNGEIGTGIPSSPGNQDRIGFIVKGRAIFTGNGNVTIHRMYTVSPGFPPTIAINMDMNIYCYEPSSGWSPALFIEALGLPSSITIQNGKTVNIYGNVSLDGRDGDNNVTYRGFIDLFGKMNIIQGALYLKSDNSSIYPQNLSIKSSGELILNNNSIIGTGASNDPNPGGGSKCTILNEGILKLKKSEPILYGIPSRSVIQNLNGSKTYLEGGLHMIRDDHFKDGKFYDLHIEGSGIKILQNDIEITNNLHLSSSSLSLTNHDLTLSKNFSGGSDTPIPFFSSTSNIITGGTGVLKFTLPANSAGNSFYIPVVSGNYSIFQISNSASTSDVFSLHVSNSVLSGGTSGNTVNNEVVQKTWNLSEQVPGGQSVNIAVHWSPSDQLSGFNTNACFIAHHDGTNWDTQPYQTATAGAFSGSKKVSRSGISSFSPFAVASGTVLPVDLIEFKAKAMQEEVTLLWRTASEINNERFEIEHSTDGLSFKKIGEVNGHGNSKTEKQYSFRHLHPILGVNYYRLNQIDYDGKNEKSKVISANINSKKSNYKLYPNIVNNQAILYLEKPLEQDLNMEVVNLKGEILETFHFPINQNSVILDLSNLPSNLYWLRLDSGEQLRFVKQ